MPRQSARSASAKSVGSVDEIESMAIIEPVCAVFRRKLKAEGLKYTPERAQVLDAIVRQTTLFEPDQIVSEVKKTGIRVSKATVYRTIKLLVEAGIIQRVPLDAEGAVYHCVFGRAPSELLVRMDTREVIALQVPELEALRERIAKQYGVQVQGHRFIVLAAAPQIAK